MSGVPFHSPEPASEHGLPPLRTAMLFFALYMAFAWISFVHPMRGLNITPWNPQAALAVALLFVKAGAWPVVWMAGACAEAIIGTERLPPAAVIVSTAAMTAGSATIAAGLRRWLGSDFPVIARQSALVFLALAAGGALLAAFLRAGALWAVGVVPFERIPAVVHRAAIGDGVGLVVTLPVLLALASAKLRSLTHSMLRTPECWVIASVTVAAVVSVFHQAPQDQFKYFYVLFVPVVWASTRFGAIGAIWAAALVQALLIAALQFGHYLPLTVFEFQLLVAAFTCTGVLLGAIVDEKQAAEEALRKSLRLAAAGDMAAALAHELNQPLTAMGTYARASQVLARRLGPHDETARGMLEIADKLALEAARAGDMVNRLRRFFRERATDLQVTPLTDLLREAMRSQSARARALRVQLSGTEGDPLPSVLVDPVQISVVLRNLLANAIEAASDPRRPPDAPRWVRLQAHRQGTEVVVTLLDSGEGLTPEQARDIFDAPASSKPGGMGIGLAISRAIVEAHAGRLWAEPGAGGRFHFTIPFDTGAVHDE
ncbi:MASE1 domain-containing protein [Ramlibacter sp. USB13]|uniref:histidine kinase n=1 Tax=Ramlibacter cellulosilyticus TaxID=2764187 RepID=A0A923MUJ2_9BURK|nr:ATP-binding protein [Ramlibacter cellulosilyticus]MBC5785430.1 MASE1 domain-containing protein [Ramlibacter cellulosilyticus]